MSAVTSSVALESEPIQIKTENKKYALVETKINSNFKNVHSKLQCLLAKPLPDGPIRLRSERRDGSAFTVLSKSGSLPVRTRSRFTFAVTTRACFFSALYLFCNCSIDRSSICKETQCAKLKSLWFHQHEHLIITVS